MRVNSPAHTVSKQKKKQPRSTLMKQTGVGEWALVNVKTMDTSRQPRVRNRGEKPHTQVTGQS